MSLEQITADKNGTTADKDDKGNRTKGADEDGQYNPYLLLILSLVALSAFGCLFCRYCKGRTGRSMDRGGGVREPRASASAQLEHYS